MAQLAIQGPLAEKVLLKLASDTDLSGIGFFKFQQEVKLNGKKHLYQELVIPEKMALKFIAIQRMLLTFGRRFYQQVKRKELFHVA